MSTYSCAEPLPGLLIDESLSHLSNNAMSDNVRILSLPPLLIESPAAYSGWTFHAYRRIP